MTEKLSLCPVCKTGNFEPFLTLKDYFLTGEEFNIVSCRECGFRFVNPRPDRNEIGIYYQSEEYISHDTARRDLFTKAYKIARNIALRNKLSLVRKYAKGKRLLDVGCGTGEFLAFCGRNGFDVKGIEPNEKARNFSKTRLQLETMSSFESFDPLREKFDCITMWHVLEHVHDLDGYLENIRALLAEDGTLIVAVPNSDSTDAKHYKEFWAAWDVPRHIYHFTRESMQRLAEIAGFEIREILPQKMDSYYVSMLSEKYRHGSNRHLSAFIQGLRSNLAAGKDNRGHSSLIFILSRKSSNFKPSV
jgi:2-polyprenyl-3-methyl-5-hydroxy-6-metoxy-1,4-benzoquinol methylase